MLRPGGDKVNSYCLNAGAARRNSRLDHVPAHPIEGPREQAAQGVGALLAGRSSRRLALGLHSRPDLFSIYVFSASGEKNLAGGVFLPFAPLRPCNAVARRSILQCLYWDF